MKCGKCSGDGVLFEGPELSQCYVCKGKGEHQQERLCPWCVGGVIRETGVICGTCRGVGVQYGVEP